MEMIQVQYYQSPYGELILGSFEGKLCMCDWVNEKRREVIDKRLQKALHADYCTQGSEVIAKAILQLEEYFARKRKAFDIPLLFIGTDFQKSVWQELLNIPYGKTVSYGELSQNWEIQRQFAQWQLPMERMLFQYLFLVIVSLAATISWSDMPADWKLRRDC